MNLGIGYAAGAWDLLNKTQEKNLETVQRRAAYNGYTISHIDPPPVPQTLLVTQFWKS